jgi:hypothetical protein
MAKTEKAVRLMKAVKVDGKWRWYRLAVDAKGHSRLDIVVVDGSEPSQNVKSPPATVVFATVRPKPTGK